MKHICLMGLFLMSFPLAGQDVVGGEGDITDPETKMGTDKEYKSMANTGLSAREMSVAINNYLAGPLKEDIKEIKKEVTQLREMIEKDVKNEIQKVVEEKIKPLEDKLAEFDPAEYKSSVAKVKDLGQEEIVEMKKQLADLNDSTVPAIEGKVKTLESVITSLEKVISAIDGISKGTKSNSGKGVIQQDKKP